MATILPSTSAISGENHAAHTAQQLSQKPTLAQRVNQIWEKAKQLSAGRPSEPSTITFKNGRRAGYKLLDAIPGGDKHYSSDNQPTELGSTTPTLFEQQGKHLTDVLSQAAASGVGIFEIKHLNQSTLLDNHVSVLDTLLAVVKQCEKDATPTRYQVILGDYSVESTKKQTTGLPSEQLFRHVDVNLKNQSTGKEVCVPVTEVYVPTNTPTLSAQKIKEVHSAFSFALEAGKGNNKEAKTPILIGSKSGKITQTILAIYHELQKEGIRSATLDERLSSMLGDAAHALGENVFSTKGQVLEQVTELHTALSNLVLGNGIVSNYLPRGVLTPKPPRPQARTEDKAPPPTKRYTPRLSRIAEEGLKPEITPAEDGDTPAATTANRAAPVVNSAIDYSAIKKNFDTLGTYEKRKVINKLLNAIVLGYAESETSDRPTIKIGAYSYQYFGADMWQMEWINNIEPPEPFKYTDELISTALKATNGPNCSLFAELQPHIERQKRKSVLKHLSDHAKVALHIRHKERVSTASTQAFTEKNIEAAYKKAYEEAIKKLPDIQKTQTDQSTPAKEKLQTFNLEHLKPEQKKNQKILEEFLTNSATQGKENLILEGDVAEGTENSKKYLYNGKAWTVHAPGQNTRQEISVSKLAEELMKKEKISMSPYLVGLLQAMTRTNQTEELPKKQYASTGRFTGRFIARVVDAITGNT